MAESCEIREHTASDGYRWKYRYYPAGGAEKAVVLYLHGIQSHGGWYSESSRRLAAAGFDVYFLDRRGSGMNEVARGDAPSFRRLLDDIAEFVPVARKPGQTLTLLTVSWGGKLGVALQRRYPGLVDALGLICPGLCPKVKMPLRQRVAIVACRLTQPTRLFPIPLNDPELFTANPERIAFLRSDPLALHQATARFLMESARLDTYNRFAARYVMVPVLLMLAGQDRIIDNERTKRLVERFATDRKAIVEYPSGHHTLEFESDPSNYFADLVQWVDAVASR